MFFDQLSEQGPTIDHEPEYALLSNLDFDFTLIPLKDQTLCLSQHQEPEQCLAQELITLIFLIICCDSKLETGLSFYSS